MDTREALRIAYQLMSRHRLVDWRVELSRHTSTFGTCNDYTRVIQLSETLVRNNDEKQVRETILHEIAHALVGCHHDHDEVWRRKAIEIGCNGRTKYDIDEVDVPGIERTAVIGNTRYKKGDPIRVYLGRIGRPGMCEFVGFNHRNIKYKVLIKYQGRKYKVPESSVMEMDEPTVEEFIGHDNIRMMMEMTGLNRVLMGQPMTRPKPQPKPVPQPTPKTPTDTLGPFSVEWRAKDSLGTVEGRVTIHRNGDVWNLMSPDFKHTHLLGVSDAELIDVLEMVLAEEYIK